MGDWIFRYRIVWSALVGTVIGIVLLALKSPAWWNGNPGWATLVAGCVQSLITALAIWTTVQMASDERKRTAERERGRAFTLSSLAAQQLATLAEKLRQPRALPNARLETILGLIDLHRGALERYNFEVLDPSAAKAFVRTFSHLLGARELVIAMSEETKTWGDLPQSDAFLRRMDERNIVLAEQLRQFAEGMDKSLAALK